MSVASASEIESFVEDELEESPWNLRRIAVIFSLCVVNALDCTNISIIAPFFPTEAKERGVPDFAIGIIFGSYSFVVFLLAPICGWLIPKYGAHKVLAFGILISSVSLFLFGVCEALHNAVTFSVLSLLLRILTAVGAAAGETAVIAIALEEFPNYLGTVVGVLEIFAGAGYAVGPAFGGFLYTVGGFRLPPFCLGSVMIAVLPILFFTLKSKQEYTRKEEDDDSSLIESLKIPGVLLIASCNINVGMLISVYIPILAPHLKTEFGMDASHIGLFFLLASLCYSVLAPLFGWIGDKTHCYRCMIVLGFLGAGVAYFTLGPAPFLSSMLPAREIWPVWVAMPLLGNFCCVVFVVITPELRRILSDRGMTDNATTNGVISGMFSSTLNLGNTLGPILGGVLYENVGFRWTTAVEGFICIGQALLVLVFAAAENLAQRKKSPDGVMGETETLLE